jgi:signal transduction histidine kinase
MRQAFTNLSVNALEAMPYGGVFTVTVMENTKGKVFIKFSDTGKGIPRELQTKVFDPFFTTKEGGTGLGLSIAHRIIHQRGGDIRVEDGGERGSTFTIALPLRKGI